MRNCARILKNRYEQFRIRVREFLKKSEFVETVITVRTRELADSIKKITGFNTKVSLIAILEGVLAVSSAYETYFPDIINFMTDLVNSGDHTISFVLESLPVMSIIIILVSVTALVISCISFFIHYAIYDTTDLVNNIVKDQYEFEEYTAVFIIKMMFGNIPKIMVFKSERWNSLFLPYCHFDAQWTEEQLKKKLTIQLAEQLEVNSTDIKLSEVDSKMHIAIKKNPTRDTKSRINYRFYYVQFENSYLAKRFLNPNLKHFIWKSKYELDNDLNTQLNNRDILDLMNELLLISNSRVAFKEQIKDSHEIPSKYRIIWNITNECHYNCPICATNSGKNCNCRTSKAKKEKILFNLSSINGYIDSLDISGGDPLKNSIDREIIQMAHQILFGADVRVTTTGEAIQNLTVEEISKTIKKCDITYDIPYEVCSDELQKYREYNYNLNNFRQLERLRSSGINLELNVHVPILPGVIEKELIPMIMEDLSRINPEKIEFIRLMPVGRMDSRRIQEYSPNKFLTSVAREIKSKKYKFKIKYNCALGTKISNDENLCIRSCDMLTQKLGIDCEGYVYACIWGAYINFTDFEKNPDSNPFYLGDLKTQTMYEILTSPKTIKLRKNLEKKRSGCRVCGLVNYINSSISAGKKLDLTNDSLINNMLSSEDPLKNFKDPMLNIRRKN